MNFENKIRETCVNIYANLLYVKLMDNSKQSCKCLGEKSIPLKYKV